jgi:hypothetical protein
MKQILIKLSQLVLLSIVIVFSSCENEELESESSATSISVAKNWFEDYKAKIAFDAQFSDLIYKWQDVSITRLTDGTQAITVPVDYPNQSIDYYGHKIMYLYPKNKGADYDVNIFEFIPNPKKVKTRQEIIDLTAFDGYIIIWDLINGFVRGSKFEENLTVNDIDLKVEYTNKNALVFRQAAGDPWEIALKEVIIVKDSKTDNGSFSYTIRNYSNTGTGTSAGNYPERPGAAGGTPSSNNSVLIVETFFTPKITDVKKELKCFDLSSGAKVTIYVDQPIAGSRKLTAETGHTFISITQNGVTRTIGFYPDSPEASLISDQDSEIHDNSTSAFDVSITVDVSSSQLSDIVKYITNYPSKFSLNNFNCTNFGINVMSLGGLALPKTVGSSFPFFKGINPADLGEDIRALKLPAGATRNLTSGKAPAKSGTCK